MEQTLVHAVEHLLTHCGGLAGGERALLIVDATTRGLARRFSDAAAAIGARMEVVEIPVADRHGIEPPPDVAAAGSGRALVLGLTRMSLAHTQARRGWCAGGTRYLSLPGYSVDLLADPCITADYHQQHGITRAIADAFTAGARVRVTTAAGTDIRLRIEGREGNCAPGFVDHRYRMGSPPDIEANVSPIETASEGIAVIDGSVSCEEIGLLHTPITLRVANGRIDAVGGADRRVVEEVNGLFARVGDDRARVLAECGVGLNPKAHLTGQMLTDEGTLGCVHFGFGSNITVGGANDVPFHVDFVCRDASLWIDDLHVLDRGVPLL